MNSKNGVEEVVEEDEHDNDLGDEDSVSIICDNHPFNKSSINPGGICAFCLQDKLGKLVISSFPITIFPVSSSSFPSLRCNNNAAVLGNGNSISSNNFNHRNASVSNYIINKSNINGNHLLHRHSRRSRIIPYLFSEKKKKKKESLQSSSDPNKNMNLKRSKSTAVPGRGRFVDVENANFIPPKRGFWSFLYHTKSAKTSTATVMTTTDSFKLDEAMPIDLKDSSIATRDAYNGEVAKKSPNSQGNAGASSSSFDRKVSRSKSVRCENRSFSRDFFEKASTDLGDCNLRRVESQRESRSNFTSSPSSVADAVVSGAVRGEHHQQDYIKERVKCGGIFGGFMTSSSSSSTSSSYWVSTSIACMGSGPAVPNRNKSWGWALSSPIRALSKPSSIEDNKPKPKTYNLSALPSLLSVSNNN